MTRRRGRWTTDARALLARHWGIAVLLACGAVLRAATMAGYQPALIFIDTPRYLWMFALGIDPLGYRYLFLKPLLALDPHLASVTAVQHLLGLAMGAALYALVLRHGGRRWLAALAAAPVLLDAYQLQTEQMIMSDVLFEALVCAAFLVLAWPAGQAGNRTWTRVAVAAVILGIATTVREVGEITLVPLLAYALLAWRKDEDEDEKEGSRHPAMTRVRLALTGGALFAIPVLAYMTYSAVTLGAGFGLSNMSNTYLYARLADSADCAALRVPSSERPLCPADQSAGIDFLANSPTSPVHTYQPPPGASRTSMFDQFDLAVLTQQPLRVAEKVAADGAKLFALTRDTAPGDTPISDWQFQAKYPVFQPAYGYVFRPGGARPQTNRVIDQALRWYQLHDGYAPGPLLLVFALLSVFGALDRSSSRQRRAAAALAGGLAIAVVGGADVYEFIWRYQLPTLVLLPPGGVLGALAVAETVRRRARSRVTLSPALKPAPTAPVTSAAESASADS
ncbi:MAG: phospholipid carrier-dependent glycosyltransferase [Streptosporangiales bacterium]|nr:phospholipid carrier-dependent glycosyltransferase [Streptosporangiales bacterium]